MKRAMGRMAKRSAVYMVRVTGAYSFIWLQLPFAFLRRRLGMPDLPGDGPYNVAEIIMDLLWLLSWFAVAMLAVLTVESIEKGKGR